MTAPRKRWVCAGCGTTHVDHANARECCAPEPEALWACGTCDREYWRQADAAACCGDGEEKTE